MAGDGFIRKPSLAVVQGDPEPMFGVVSASATVTYLVPGKLVHQYVTAVDGEIDISGAADISNNIGIVGYEATPPEYRPATRDTAYAVGDHVAIHNKPGMRFRGWMINGAAIIPGDLLTHLVADTSGNFSKYVGITPAASIPTPLARSLETKTAAQLSGGTAGTAIAVWMQWL